MTLRTRRILLVIAVVLFMIFSPLVILYSFGYRYDPRGGKMIQTGIIYIIPQPQDNVKIFINDNEETERLSIKGFFKKDYVIYNLLPQTYNIKVRRDGYSEWEKRLAVSPGVITYANPLLFPLNPANDAIFSDKSVISWSISPDFNKIAYAKNDSGGVVLSVYDINQKSTKSISLKDIEAKLPPSENISTINTAGPSRIPDFKAQISWAPDSRNFILMTQTKSPRLISLNSSDQGITYLSSATPDNNVIQSAWSSENSSFIFLTDTGELYQFNSFSDVNKPLKIADKVLGFSIENSNIHYLDSQNLFIYKFPIANPDARQQISFKPLINSINQDPEKQATEAAKLIVSGRSDIAVIMPGNDLFLVRQNGIPAYLDASVNSAKFSADGSSLLHNSSSEIFTYSLSDGTEKLVTRLAKKIGNVEWYKDYEHVWFTGNGILKNIELDSRPVPNTVDFHEIPQTYTNITYNTNSDRVYYDKLDNNTLTIYQLNIGVQ